MQLRRPSAFSAAAAAVLLSLSLSVLLPSTAYAQNITHILAGHPSLSLFNKYLTKTHLAAEINGRQTITVCAVDDAAMNLLLSNSPALPTIKNVLYFHVLLDYFDPKKLHQLSDGSANITTLFQTTGSATESSGFVNIADLTGGKVRFSPLDSPNISATFVKNIQSIPYNLSVIQISSLIASPEAEAPSPAPAPLNLTALMSATDCKIFAETLRDNPQAQQTFDDNVQGGLTVFCPSDDAMKKFLPEYNKNLSTHDKQSVLEYHGIPVYESLAGLKSGNGVFNTLATDGAKKYNFTVQNDGSTVTVKTGVVTAKIVTSLLDEQQLAIYKLDKVLLPKELFKSDLSPAPAPAPGPEADAESPKPSRNHKSPPAPAAPADSPSDSPADAPDGDPADQTDDNGGERFSGGRFGAVILSLCLLTGVVTAKIITSLVNEQQLAIYKLDKVLLPKELFKSDLAPAPAPSRNHKSPPAPAAPSDSPADAPDGDLADQTADDSGGERFSGGRFGAVILCLLVFQLQL
ncbi:FASCICLIN-like arabinogalactan 1 [Striga asiatica]|uniref:FASCICLIN-like arabinogalactan 1 n=1 Tax=Striga asiatica TaxID=4170 RepID=A0A5A7QLJ2_STRAF|nr:FASCICLIN-like arabinogalactan 1 [Striga asiatica]